jgi:Flp pilus assembly protein TadD
MRHSPLRPSRLAATILAVFVLIACGGSEDSIERGWRLYESGKAFDARDLALTVAKDPPHDTGARVRVAELLVAVRKPRKALDMLEGERLDPHGRDVLAMAQLRAGRTDEAERTLRKLVVEKEDTALTHRLLGEMHLFRRDARGARRELDRSRDWDANDPLTYLYLQETWRMEGREDRAEELLRGAPEAVRETPEVRAALGYVIMSRRGGGEDRGALEEAVEHLRFVEEKRPLDQGSRSTLGVALRRLGRLPEAEAVFRSLTEDFPDSPDHLADLGAVLLDQQRAPEAVRVLTRARELAPKRMKVILNLGEAYLMLAGQVDERKEMADKAFAIFEEATRIAEGEPLAWVGLGRSRVKADPGHVDIGTVLRYYQIALGHDRNCFAAHLNLALLLHDLWIKDESSRGDVWKNTLDHFEAAAKLKPPETWDPHARTAFEDIAKTKTKRD